MSEKLELAYRGVLILLIIFFLAIFYQYSENGRYSYHKEIQDFIDKRYVVDTRTGIIYGETFSTVGQSNFYEIDLKAGRVLLKPHKIIDPNTGRLPKTIF